VRKCPYCDFNSHALRQALPEDAYIDALLADLEQQLPKVWGRRLTSIFIGGGTPSLFSPEAIERLLNGIRAYLPFSSALEITLEANPGTVEQQRFIGYRQAGINRLSLGIQSFQDDKLKALGRIHDSHTAKQAIIAVKTAGFDNFNIDLMFGLPEQTLSDALYDLQTAIDLQPTHISWYQLTLEPNTVFHRYPPTLPLDDDIWYMQEQGIQLLAQAGYQQYEISAYNQPKQQCQHNRNYWEFGDYLGIGAGAHGKITDFQQQTVTRYWNTRQPKDYLDCTKAFTAGERQLDIAELPFEFMLNVLRLSQTIPFTLFNERCGLPLEIIKPTLEQAQQKGLLTTSNYGMRLTDLGKRFLNDVVQMFLPDCLSNRSL
jgi:oxygen-independent coproporphyrinogen-3 oxidase